MKFFRGLIGLHDTFYQAILTHHNIFGLILDIVHETMPRDNLLNSACLELFEYIRRENIKPLVVHVVEKYREKLNSITYVDTFINLVNRYEQMQGYEAEAESALFAQGEEAQARRMRVNGQRWPGVGEMDAAEEAYFNTSDDEDEVSQKSSSAISLGYANRYSGSKPTRQIPRRMALISPLQNHWSITLTTTTTKMLWIHRWTRHKLRNKKKKLPRSKKLPKHQSLPPRLRHHLHSRLRNDYQKNVAVKRRMKMS